MTVCFVKFSVIKPGCEFGFMPDGSKDIFWSYKLHPEDGVEFNATVNGRLVKIDDDTEVMRRSHTPFPGCNFR